MISDHRYKNRFHVFFLMVCMGGFVILQTVYDLGGTLVGIALLFTDHFPDGVMHPFDSVAEYFVFCVKAHDLNVHFCNDLTAVETLMWCGDPFYVRRIAL